MQSLRIQRSAVAAARRSGLSHDGAAFARYFSSTPATLDNYDVTIIGGGPGGYVAAIKAAQLGLKTACVEFRGSLGGTCLNVGCIPSKALLHSTHLYHHAKHDFKTHGIKVSGVEMDFGAMMKHKEKAVRGLTGGIEHLFKKYKVDYVKGKGKISGKGEISVTLNDGGEKKIKSKNIVIATGSEVTPLPPVPVDNAKGKIVDSTGALALKDVPKSLIVVGGGVIGLEMGSVYQRLGSQVTVVEFMDRIVPSLDTEIGKQFQQILTKQGFKFMLGTKVTSSKVDGDKVTLTVEPAKGGASQTLETDVVLVSTGRRPYTDGLGLKELGVETDKLGRVLVDSEYKTNVDGIYAIGDCIPGPMLAHKAEEEGIAAVETIAGSHGHVNYSAIPGVIYTWPEVASVGKTEQELKEAKVAYNVGSFPMMANSRARTIDEAVGLVKVISDKETDRMLGVHIIGPNAGEMIAEGVIGIEYGASSEDLARTCHAHPTMSEAFKEACMATYDKPIHF